MSDRERKLYRCARGARCVNAVPRPSECPCGCHGQSAMNRLCSIEGGCGHLHAGEDTELDGGLILSSAGLCEDCRAVVVRALDDLPLSYVELEFLLASGESGITDVIVSSTQDLPIPIRVSVEGLMSRMVAECAVWAELLAPKLGVNWDAGRMKLPRPGWLLQRATRLLVGAPDKFLALPSARYRHGRDCEWIVRDGIDAALELLRIHGLVRFVAGKTKLVHELPAPCPRCERMTLVRRNGSDLVECEACPRKERAWWHVDEYKRLTLILADSWRDEVPVRTRVGLCSGDEGTTGSAGDDTVDGRVVRPWPLLPMVEFPEVVA